MADLFRGYIESNGKKSFRNPKDESNWLKTPPIKGDYVGVLNNKTIQLDFDHKESTDKIMEIVNKFDLQCDVLETTRGIHLYFEDDGNVKDQSVKSFTALGLEIDCGLGSKYRQVPLRGLYEGQTEVIERKWLKQVDKLQVLPSYLRPIGKIDYGLNGLIEGSRNNLLYSYILVLQTNNFTKEEVRETIKMINKFILAEPLPDVEIDVIIRDSAFSEEIFFNGKNQLKHNIFGDYMINNCNIILRDSELQIYDGRLFRFNKCSFSTEMIRKIPTITRKQREEVYSYIQERPRERMKETQYSDPRYIGLKDNIYDLKTRTFVEYSPTYVLQNCIDTNYNPEAYCEDIDIMLDTISCGDKQIRNLLEEMIGYTLYRSNSFQLGFFLLGGGANGKSTLLDAIENMIGKRNTASLSLAQLGERFTAVGLYNKMANILHEVTNKKLTNTDILKKLVTGDSMLADVKYGQAIELENIAKFIMCANELPHSDDKTHGFMRRFIVIPLKAVFDEKLGNINRDIENIIKTKEATEYLLKLALDGLHRVLENDRFTKSDLAELEMKKYRESMNTIGLWIEDSAFEPLNNTVHSCYLEYIIWCDLNLQDTEKLNKVEFSKEIIKLYGYTSKVKKISGKAERVYVLPEDVAC